MDKFLSDFGKFANSKDVKHVVHKLSPITDALIAKGASKVQSLKTGGRVKGKRGMPKMIQAHGGEYVLPASVKPTKAQVKAVAAHRARARKGKM
jgi:hypothetical protein